MRELEQPKPKAEVGEYPQYAMPRLTAVVRAHRC